MAKSKYLTAPDPQETSWPKGVKYIIGNEGCERFSFYGMKSVLQVHITALFVAAAMAETAAEEHAQEMVHLFVAGVYAFPMIGAIVADRWLGKYHTILTLSLVYCLGHFVLSIAENTLTGMWIGLGLIAVGSGGIKPCVSAHVGDQFGKSNWHLVDKVFQAFYFIINFGSFFATLAIPAIRAWEHEHLDWSINIAGHEFQTSIAFGLPGVLMFIATILFWMGRKVFVHVPANPGGKLGFMDTLSSSFLFMGFIGLPMFFFEIMPALAFWPTLVGCIVVGGILFAVRQKMQQDDGFLAVMFYSLLHLGQSQKGGSKVDTSVDQDSVRNHWFFAAAAKKFDDITAEGPRAVLRIVTVFILISVFWALFDQHASSWIRQAQRMDLNTGLGFTIGSFSWNGDVLPSQVSALNPLMVMTLIPLNLFLIYPAIDKYIIKLTPLRKMTIGMFVASLAFAVVAWIQMRVDAGGNTDKVSVLWQILPYLIMTQSEVMVSITGLEFAYTQAPARMKSTIMGFWLLTVALGNKLVAIITKIPDMPLANFFWLFAGLMAVAAAIFGVRGLFYTYKDYSQE